MEGAQRLCSQQAPCTEGVRGAGVAVEELTCARTPEPRAQVWHPLFLLSNRLQLHSWHYCHAPIHLLLAQITGGDALLEAGLSNSGSCKVSVGPPVAASPATLLRHAAAVETPRTRQQQQGRLVKFMIISASGPSLNTPALN